MLNTTNLLSRLTLRMDQAAELLRAEQPAIDEVSTHAARAVEELSISTCRDALSRYERIFGLAPAGTPEERAAALLLRLNSRPPATKEYLESLLASATGCRCRIEESFGQYRFAVYIRSTEIIPDMEKTAAYVRLLKPAHLEAALHLQRQTGGRVILPCRAAVGRRIRVRPYQAPQLAMEALLHAGAGAKVGRHIQIRPKEDVSI